MERSSRSNCHCAHPPRADGSTILILEDDQDFRMALADMLRDDGHRVEAFDAPSSVPPLESLGHVAVLVTDYQLPESNGLEFADAFHTAYPSVPIILVTADPCSHLDGAAGSRPYVQLHRKPIDYRTLNASIRKGLAHDRIR